METDLKPNDPTNMNNQQVQEQTIEVNNDSDDDYTLCPFFKPLVIDNDPNERDACLQAYQIFIAKNKPSYKLLEDELMILINKHYERLRTDGQTPLKILVERLLDLYETAKKKGMNPLAMKVFLKITSRVKYEHKEDFTEDVKKVALAFWTHVDGLNLTNFLAVFDIQDKVNPEDLLPIINELILQQKLTEAACCISAMELQKHFEIPDMLSKRVHQNKFPIASMLVKKDPVLQKTLIKEMTTNKLSSKAADLIKAFGLNHKEFPDLLERLEKNCLRYYGNKDPWYKVEETFFDHPRVIAFYVEDQVFKQNFDVALSLCKRHNLWERQLIKKPDTINELTPFYTNPPTKTYQYLENPLFEKDAFDPTEEVLGEAQCGNYWHFKDFGVDISKELVWIDNCDCPAFEQAAKEMLSSEAVAMDSEFKTTVTKFDSRGLALLQLAIPSGKIYIIDTLKVSSSPKYNSFIRELFENPKVLKIGHTLTADLETLRQDQDQDDTEFIMRNHLDLPRVFKSLHPELKQSSLAFICEKILGKPMSKYEQISNWSHRPVRKTQVHYAAMDAYILLKIYDVMCQELAKIGEDVSRFVDSSVGGPKRRVTKTSEEDEDQEQNEEDDGEDGDDQDDGAKKSKSKEKGKFEQRKKPYRPKGKDKKDEGKKQVDEENKEAITTEEKEQKKKKPKQEGPLFNGSNKYASWYADSSNIAFIVDNMCFKLAKYMRNLGLDAEYQETKDHHAMTELAKTEQRVILTRDRTYFARNTGIPTLLLSTMETDAQMKEVIDYFKMNVTKERFLSRCVKCNHPGLIIINQEDAKKQLQWKNVEDYALYEYYFQCEKCKQIYWEGNTFKKARDRFKEFASTEDGENKAGADVDGQKSNTGSNSAGLDTEIQNFDFGD